MQTRIVAASCRSAGMGCGRGHQSRVCHAPHWGVAAPSDRLAACPPPWPRLGGFAWPACPAFGPRGRSTQYLMGSGRCAVRAGLALRRIL